MEYSSKTMNRAEDFFTEAYDFAMEVVVKPIKTVLKVGTIVVTILFSPGVANAEVYNTDSSQTTLNIEESINNRIGESDVKPSLSIDYLVKKTAMLRNLNKTFESHFKPYDTDKDAFKPVFDEVAAVVSDWEVLDSFVDVSRERNLVDFNLAFPYNLFVSVAKSVHEDNSEVMFSIARNGRTLVIDKLTLEELNVKVLGMMDELNANADIQV